MSGRTDDKRMNEGMIEWVTYRIIGYKSVCVFVCEGECTNNRE